MVANVTQSKYGNWINVIHCAKGKIIIIAQTNVPSTSKTSTAASVLFFKPNCIGVNAKLKTKFSKNGKAMANVICLSINIKPTLAKDKPIKTYNSVQTGAKSHGGGAQDGLESCEYD